MTEPLHALSLLEVSDRIRRRRVSAETVTRALIDRIERLDPQLNSVLRLLGDSALAEARRADAEITAGFWRGPLHGVPIGVKDLLWTKGEPTTGGMEILKDFRPSEDATVVRRLRRAGAVVIAKLHTTEGATLDHHPTLRRPVNPWSPAHWTGVSSSGSGVATAAGFCFGALGTDTAGSIRFPSAANNLTGLKPTWGRVSRHGLLPLSESLDHIGPMARSAADAAAILQVIAGPDPADGTTLADPVPDYLAALGQGVRDLSIGVDWRFAAEGVPQPVAQAVRAAAEVFAELGARIRPIDFPDYDAERGPLAALLQAEVCAAHAEHFPDKAERYGPRLRAMLAHGSPPPGDVVRGYQARDRFTGRLHAAFRDVDLILPPGIGAVLPTWEEMDFLSGDLPGRAGALLRFSAPYNAAGVPTLSLPGGFTADGLPVGVQLAGWKLAEPLLLRAGQAFQQATDHHVRRPPLD
jgi:amidase